MAHAGTSLAEHFAALEDPRAEHLTDHKLIDIVMIAVCGVICGAETWTDIELFGQERQAWLGQFLELENGIPSHDTFGRVFARIDTEQFQICFASWAQAIFQATKGEVVALDGKTVRRSHDRSNRREAIHVVSAWATANHLVLGQQKVAEKSNEIKAFANGALISGLVVSGGECACGSSGRNYNDCWDMCELPRRRRNQPRTCQPDDCGHVGRNLH